MLSRDDDEVDHAKVEAVPRHVLHLRGHNKPQLVGHSALTARVRVSAHRAGIGPVALVVAWMHEE